MATVVAAVKRWVWRLVTWPLWAALVIALYYAVGAHFAHRIDTDPDFAATVDVPDGGARTVAVLAALVEREVDQHGWVANDPWIFPSSTLDDMATFQTTLLAAVNRTLADLEDLVEGDAPSPALEAAMGALAMPGDRWTFDFAQGFAPQQTSEQFYRDGVAALRRFNGELAAGETRLALDAAAATAILERLAAELDAAAAANLRHVADRGGHWLDLRVDDRFLASRGEAYAVQLLVPAMAADGEVEVGAATVERTARALASTSVLQPWLVLNGRADAQWRASHLAAQAAYIQRAARDVRALASQSTAGGA